MSTFLQRFRRFCKPRTVPAQAGFTLVELLVVTAIIIIITMLLLLRQSKFDSSILLRSLTYSVALSVRQAQIYGTSIFGFSQTGADTFASGYGLYFSTSNPSSYILFADLNNDGQYETAPQDETVKVFTLSSGYTIGEICGVAGSLKSCSGADDTSGSPISWLSVVFRRPNPDACFAVSTFPSNCAPGVPAVSSNAYIQVLSPDGTQRSVYVSSTGEIAVQAPATLP